MPRTVSQPAIAYETHGERGPRVLLIMGFSMRGALWRPQLEGLKGDHQLASFDHRGLGDSASSGRLWTMATFAEDALRVCDALDWETAHVVGVSMGGMIAQELALRAPKRVRSLSLIATHPGGGPLSFLPPTEGLGLFLRAQMPGDGRIDAIRRLLYPAAYLATCDRAALNERMRNQLMRPVPRQTLIRQLIAISRHDTRARLSSLEMPTLIVKPSLDLLVPPQGSDRLAKAIPHARLVVLEDAGHGAIFQRASAVNDAVRRNIHEADLMALSAGRAIHA
ncbi:MAG: alpha/beta fold hydrolase [Myxococcota bacterium]